MKIIEGAYMKIKILEDIVMQIDAKDIFEGYRVYCAFESR
jgi:hypothetical protein